MKGDTPKLEFFLALAWWFRSSIRYKTLIDTIMKDLTPYSIYLVSSAFWRWFGQARPDCGHGGGF